MIIGYIKEENIDKKHFKRVNVREINNNYIISIENKDKIKTKKKLVKCIQKLKINAVVFSKNLEGKFEDEIKEFIKKYYENSINITILDGKKIMEYMQFEIIQYIMKKQGTNMKKEDIYIVFKEDKSLNLKFLERFIENFKTTNVVTNEIERMRNIQNNLLENEDILISVSNNKRKALKRAKYILNVNLNKEELEKYKINRNAIIINIRENIKYDNTIFDGINITNCEIALPDEYIEKFEILQEEFDLKKLYESILLNQNINSRDMEKIYDKIRCDKVKIVALIGNNGKIGDQELLQINCFDKIMH